MQKFELQQDKLKLDTLLDCIIQGSAFATKHRPENFYTYKGKPEDWSNIFAADIRRADKVRYKDRVFYGIISKDDSRGDYTYFFYQGNMYCFDPYFTDCPILAEILKE
jgi:hypothetical protein